MPFGLEYSPSTFQRAIEIFLSLILYQSNLHWLDYIIIVSPNITSRLKHLRQIFQMLSYDDLSINMRKSFFLNESV